MRHTSCHTTPLYLIERKGVFYFNRRAPKHAVATFGPTVRVRLSDEREEAEALARCLGGKLDEIWTSGSPKKIDLEALIDACRPRPETLSRWVEEYVDLKGIDPEPLRTALTGILSIVGDKDVRDYRREDARAFVQYMASKGNRSATILRRLKAICAVLNYAYAELDVEQRNPFSRLHVKGVGQDATRRGTFTEDELRGGASEAFSSGHRLRLLFPVLAETGCRLAEVVGLRMEDIGGDQIRVVPHGARRLKTTGSEREVPLVGVAQLAMRALVETVQGDDLLFANYLRKGEIQATFASNALNRWIKGRFPGRTAHGLRHTFRDRLRAVECPLEMIDALGGWSSIGSAGSRYGRGFRLEHKREWLSRIAMKSEL